MSGLTLLAVGALATVQDRGRIGWAHLGVPRAGALDAPAAALANRVVGNGVDDAVIEVTLGGFAARLDGVDGLDGAAGGGRWAALTGAPAPLTLAGRTMPVGAPFWWPTGAELRIGAPTTGVRSYLAVAGGIAVEPVLGSRATDLLAGVGPDRLRAGDLVPLGAPAGTAYDLPTVRRPRGEGLRLQAGPRAEWFTTAARRLLVEAEWTVRPDSDRIGMRLAGPMIERETTYRGRELASEPMVLGAVQIPPQGQPIVFLADHPPTGGYPVIGVVDPDDLWQCAQVRPGDRLRFRNG
ncbi:biotin-dependent carboxyltransferase family protein [Nocardioides sp.]|uniref:5-oxoprolinase subunit C family protein n=1 Tax=Nocardioides sp. TaxID=35761 RepID=UPI0026281F41|nr:biotin-dependent carboxyltransferase family protein [Nocardioides sp.]